MKHWKGELLPFISACTGKEVNPILRCLEYEFSPVCSVRFAGKSQFVVIEFCYFDLGNACADNFPAVWTSLQANVNSHYGHRSVIFLKENDSPKEVCFSIYYRCCALMLAYFDALST